MEKVFIDADFHCHTSAGDGLKEVETKFFDGKCSEFIEGYRYIPPGERWTREDGVVFDGEMISPWKPWEELDAAQLTYERGQISTMRREIDNHEEAISNSVSATSAAEERIAELETQNETLLQCVLEMSEIVYA